MANSSRTQALTAKEHELVLDGLVHLQHGVREHPAFFFWTTPEEIEEVIVKQKRRLTTARQKEAKKNAK